MNAATTLVEGRYRKPKWHERSGWILLLLGQAWGMLISLLLVAAPLAVMDNPEFRAGSVPNVIRAWGATLLVLTVVGLAILLTGFRRGQ